MTKQKVACSFFLQRISCIVQLISLVCLLALPTVGISAEPKAPTQPYTPVETTAVPGDSTELRIFKQRLEITAEVFCRIVRKGPSYCAANIGSVIQDTIEPEMILKYLSIELNDQEFVMEETSEGQLKFRTDKVDYSGPQVFEIEIIYLK